MGLYDIFLRTGACVWMVAELLLASAIRLPAYAPQELLWRSVGVLLFCRLVLTLNSELCATQVGLLRWAMWSTLGERMGSWRSLGIRTPYAPYAGGGLHRERGGVLHYVSVIKSFSFFVLYHPQRVRPQPWASQNDVS
jgi:hypothetical protein